MCFWLCKFVANASENVTGGCYSSDIGEIAVFLISWLYATESDLLIVLKSLILQAVHAGHIMNDR